MSLSQPMDFTPKYFAKIYHIKEHQLDLSLNSSTYNKCKSYAMLSTCIPWNIPEVTWYLQEPLQASVYTEKIQVTSGILNSMVYQKRALHNYNVSCHIKYSGQHNQYNIHAAYDWKVGVQCLEQKNLCDNRVEPRNSLTACVNCL